jgi:hypothetical protein
MTTTNPIKPRERDTVIQALVAGVVPRVGLHHIQVGRAAEVGAILTASPMAARLAASSSVNMARARRSFSA